VDRLGLRLNIDNIWWWVARRLPTRLIYFSTIVLWAYGTTGKYGSTNAVSISVPEALERWNKMGK
jgi:hypothetical protein